MILRVPRLSAPVESAVFEDADGCRVDVPVDAARERAVQVGLRVDYQPKKLPRGLSQDWVSSWLVWP